LSSLSIPWVDLGLFSSAAALGIDGQILPMMGIRWGKCLDFLGLCRIHQFTVARMCGMWENVCCPADQRQRTNPETSMKAFLPLVQNGTVIETSGLRRRIATVPHKASPVPVPDAAANNLAEAHALAAFLVHAANSHGELVGMLEAAANRVELANAEGDQILSAWLVDARALLSRLSV
jgi:hypothetical protein